MQTFSFVFLFGAVSRFDHHDERNPKMTAEERFKLHEELGKLLAEVNKTQIELGELFQALSVLEEKDYFFKQKEDEAVKEIKKLQKSKQKVEKRLREIRLEKMRLKKNERNEIKRSSRKIALKKICNCCE